MRMLNNPTSLKLLVSASLMLLLCFLGYWNFQNYDRIKSELHKDLTDQMSLASSDYKDSIVQVIFNDIDEISLNVDVRINESDFSFIGAPDSMLNSAKKLQNFPSRLKPRVVSHTHLGPESLQVRIDGEHSNADSTFTVFIDQERDRKVIVWSSDIESGDQYELVSDSLKFTELTEYIKQDSTVMNRIESRWLNDSLMVPRIHRVENKVPRQLPNLYLRIDSLFSMRLENQGLNLEHVVVSLDRKDDSTPLPDMAIPLEYGDLFGTGRAYALFEDYNNYIFGKMAPSILMSLFLFSMMAFSFYFILRSWLSQLRLTKVKNEFISNMTHELKTPISTVGVAIEALESFGGIDDAKKRSEYLEISKHELNRLTILVDKVLKMSTLESGADEMIKTEVDVKSLTEDMLNSMKLHFEKNHVILDYKVKGEDFSINGDKVHLTNVLYNLIDNAIKYSGDNPMIKVHLSSQPNLLNLSISDNGPGIPKEYQSKVFDRFFRVPSDDKHNVKGHGLGLHYVKTVVANHQGIVRLKSDRDEGTTFIITIPRKDD